MQQLCSGPGQERGIDRGWLSRRYAVGLAVLGVLACVNFLVVWLLLGANGEAQRLLLSATQVSRLAQDAAHQAQVLAHAPKAEQVHRLADLTAATARLQSAYGTLVEARAGVLLGPQPPLPPPLRQFLADLEAVGLEGPELTGDAPPLLRAAAEAAPGSALAAALDALEAALREGAAARASALEVAAVAVLAVSLLVLGLEVLFVFRPMAEVVEDRITAALGLAQELRRIQGALEKEVSLRTEELRRAKDIAERASLAKSRFLAAAGHDLMQPVKALGLMVTLMERSRAMGGEPLVADLRGAITSATGLLKGLLDFSKVEAGLLRAEPRHLSLQPLITQLGNEMRLQTGSSGVRFRSVPASLVVDSDPVLLERILRNLLSNALRYTASGRVLLGCRRRGGSVRIEVHDTGPGIAEHDLDRVFAAFTRGEVEPDDEALGLGLAIADRMARLLGHRLGVRSTEGRGSVFWVEVPLVAWLPHHVGAQGEANQLEPDRKGGQGPLAFRIGRASA